VSGVDALDGSADCTAIMAAIDAPLLPSAPPTRFPLLLVEDPGPWSRDAIADSARVPDGLWPRAWQDHGVRIMLIRRVGRRREDGRRVLVVHPGPDDPWIEQRTLTRDDELLELDLDAIAAGRRPGLGQPVDGPVLLACTHGKVDRCCARYGRSVATALAAAYPEATWESTHVGGCRYAANLLVAPELTYYGRLTPASAVEVVDRHLRGHATTRHLRGHAGLPHPAQRALTAVREAEGLDGLDDVRVVATELDPGEERRAVVTLAAPSGRHQVTVEERDLATTAYGCGSDERHTWTEHVVVRHVTPTLTHTPSVDDPTTEPR
jgi:hypothetical protein